MTSDFNLLHFQQKSHGHPEIRFGSNIWEPEDGNSSQNFGRCFFLKERQPQKIGFPLKHFRVVAFNQKKRKHNLSNSNDLLKFAA